MTDRELLQQEPVPLEIVYQTIIQWDEGGGKRSRRELARRITALYTAQQAQKPLTDEKIKRIEETTTCVAGESWLRNLCRNIEAAHNIK